ncbi:MAG TPA: AraC family transcriptional regulator [Steroidobacteraceae bacterium]|jgi:AraC-like DNA-binding protein|nr:AraC family transcriptional regulator [Steroidobacteraceae bacterium]
MSMQELFFSVDAIGFFSVVLFGLRVLVTSAKRRNARLIALICFNSACAIALARQDYAYWIPEAYQVHVGLLRIPLHVARNMTSGLLMILCHSLFQDESKLPRWLAGAFALQVLMEFAGAVRSTNGAEWQHDVLQMAPASLQLLFVGYALYWMLRGWSADLVEARRKLRWIFLVIVGTFMFFAILLERLLIPWAGIAEFYVHLTLSMLLAMLAVFALFATFRSDEPVYIDPFREETSRAPAVEAKSVPVAGASDGTIAAVRRAFVEQHVHRDGDLTVASLAQKLAMPEYRLRKLIHEQLGYRNFNALLHEYRLAEACRELGDPNKNNLPILTIALTVGYNSINPFNRAFREATGMTPSVFRAQAQARGSEIPGGQTLAES